MTVGHLPREVHDRRLAARARKALRAAGIRHASDVRALHGRQRLALLGLPGFGPRAYDFLNEALNDDDEQRLRQLFNGG
jgi:hypothetical protein